MRESDMLAGWKDRLKGKKKAVIPEGVTSIPRGLLEDLTELEVLDLPRSLTYYSWSSFTPLRSLRQIVTDRDALAAEIALLLDVECVDRDGQRFTFQVPERKGKWLVEPDKKHNGIRLLGCRGKIGHTGLADFTTVIIPEEIKGKPVTCIGAKAFESCESADAFYIPDTVQVIESRAFGHNGYCKKCGSGLFLRIPKYASIAEDAFEGTEYFTRDGFSMKDGVLKDYCGPVGNVVIPEGVTKIGRFAFKDCPDLTGVTIPKGVKQIKESAFEGCTGLTSVTIPEGVKQIREFAFGRCFGLTGVSIPESVTYIWDYAFLFCGQLARVTIPQNVKQIGFRAFRGCSSLTNVIILGSTTQIEKEAFYECENLMCIIAPKGSCAEKYAEENGIPFAILFPKVGIETDYADPDSTGAWRRDALISRMLTVLIQRISSLTENQ